MFTRMGYILGHKLSLKKCKVIKIIQSIFSDHNEIKLESNKISRKIPKVWKKWKHFKLNDNKNLTYQNLWNVAKAVLRGNLYLEIHILGKVKIKKSLT